MNKGILKTYPLGSNLTILNTIYEYPRKKENGKYDDGRIVLMFKDNNTGLKHIETIENPDYTFYKTKDDVYLDHHLFFIEKDKVDEITVPYNSILKEIASMTGNTEWFYDNIKNGNRRANNQLHSICNEIFGSDVNIEDHYRFLFMKQYTNDIIKVSKSYFDIEVDTINMVEDFPPLGAYPINAVTYIFKDDVHTFLLRDPSNPLVEQFENEVKEGKVFNEIKEFVINHVGGEKYARKHGILDFKYSMHFYDEEIDLIKELFVLINMTKPDFLLAWNMAFDIPYVYERIKVLGYDPAEIMCPKDVTPKIAKYHLDFDHIGNPELRGDYFLYNGYTVLLDQLVQFTSRRRGQGAFPSHKLDYIGEKIAKVHKLDYSKVTRSIKYFPRTDYKLFTIYNIIDTIVQHCIENKVDDISYVFNKCLINNTRYSKAHRQTVYLTNRAIKEFDKLGFILGNNINKSNPKPPKFPGAMVADTTLNSDYAKVKIDSRCINVVKNMNDFDYKALYPSIMMEFNMAPNTQIGRVLIEFTVHDMENRFNYGKWTRGGAFLADLSSGNTIEFCRRWLHLAGYKDIIKDMNEYFNTHRPKGNMNPTFNRELVRFYDIPQNKSMAPVHRPMNKSSLVSFYPEKKDFSKEINMLKLSAQMDLDSIQAAMRRKEAEEFEDSELLTLIGEDVSAVIEQEEVCV